MASVMRLHCCQLVNQCVNMGMHLITLFDHAHVKTLVSTFECQVSQGSNPSEVVNHQCNLAYASK